MIFNIIVRILQWVVPNIRHPDIRAISLPLDDVFFVGLLVISVLMMAGGLTANTYLIWSLQRTQREDALLVQETLETDSRLRELEQKVRAKEPIE